MKYFIPKKEYWWGYTQYLIVDQSNKKVTSKTTKTETGFLDWDWWSFKTQENSLKQISKQELVLKFDPPYHPN